MSAAKRRATSAAPVDRRPSQRAAAALDPLLGGVAALALAVRLFSLWQLSGSPPAELLVGDGVAYDEWARQIVAGPWLGSEVFYQAPLYPYFLACLYSLFGPSLLAVRLVQALLGATACVFLALAGARFFERRAGLLAGALLAVWPSAVFADALIQKTALDTFLFCALLACTASALQRHAAREWLAAGALAGALALTRENAIVFAPVLAVAAWSSTPARGLPTAAALLAGMALVLTPVAVRNLAVGGELHLTTAQFGPNFFIGNNPRATGLYRPLLYGRGDARHERRDATQLAEQALARSLSPAEVSSYWTGRALGYIAEQPGDWIRLLGRKAMLTVNRVEVGDAEDPYTYGDWSTALALLNPVLNFGLLVPLAAASVVLLWRRNRFVPLLLALLATYALTVIATYVMGRYRQPLLPLLLLFAAAGIVEGAAAVQARRWRRLGPALALAAILAVAANWPLISEASVRSASLYNLGRSLEDQPGRRGEAVAMYRRAVAIDPWHALAHNNLGLSLQRQGALDEALVELRRAIEIEPGQGDFPYNLGGLLAERGDLAGAEAAYRRAVEIDPGHADAHNNLGVLLQQRGALAAAAVEFEAAVAADPQNVGALNNLGVNQAQRGELDLAVATFRRALTVDPQSAAARDNLARALADAASR